MILFLYCLLLAALLVYAPAGLLDPGAREFLLIIGTIGVWRYGWGFVHFIRAQIYRWLVFPRWRRQVDQLTGVDGEGQDDGVPTEPHQTALAVPTQQDQAVFDDVYIVVTSYRIHHETTIAVFRSLFEEAQRYPGRVTIVASIVEMGDQRLVKQLFTAQALPMRVRLVLVRMAGSGKRDGLAAALKAVARRSPPAGAAVLVMDGDTLLPPHGLARVVPFLRIMPEVAGITTDEDCIVEGGPLITTWHRLRFAQRQILMCSMALSRRLLTMTGRLSLYRAEVATDPGFIEQIRDDAIEHWRFGRIKLLTGEDKSTWFWLLEHGRPMLYVPDVRIWTIEHPPPGGFLEASTRLMTRWFGNMLRAGGRAITLGPQRIGLFTWWCLVDQRLSMWTPLIGPVAVACLAATVTIDVLYVYLLWVMLTRLVQTLMLLTVRDTISGLYPILIYFNQVYGALVKTWMMFRLNRQRWTRQQTELPRQGEARPLRSLESALIHGLAMLALITAVAFMTGVLALPPPSVSAGLWF